MSLISFSSTFSVTQRLPPTNLAPPPTLTPCLPRMLANRMLINVDLNGMTRMRVVGSLRVSAMVIAFCMSDLENCHPPE